MPPDYRRLNGSNIEIPAMNVALLPKDEKEVAAMVAWIAGPECSFTTGAVFDLSGGRATY